jgi:hypothetical protein
VFKAEQHKFLILLNKSSDTRSREPLTSLRKLAKRNGILVLHATFSSLVKAAENCLSPHDEEMIALVKDYELFCSVSDLLPTDEYTIFVPPCGDSVEDNIQFSLYHCPTTRKFRKAKYLGIYANKSIQAIGKISKIVSCDVDLKAKRVKEGNDQEGLTTKEQQRIVGACIGAQKYGWDLSRDRKFFLCDEMVRTHFTKKSKWGIQGHRYIDLKEILGEKKIPGSLEELATLLRTHEWK